MKVDIKNIEKKYRVIYADSLWHYNNKRTGKRISGRAVNHYPFMNLPELKDLPVGNLADDNCMLFIWVAFEKLEEGMELMESWGFTYYKILGFFNLVKMNKRNRKSFLGIRYYTSSNCEVCMIGVKGKPIKVSDSVSSVVISHRSLRMEHIRKLDSVREDIVRLCGNVPRIELFARQEVEGWDCWGNEV